MPVGIVGQVIDSWKGFEEFQKQLQELARQYHSSDAILGKECEEKNLDAIALTTYAIKNQQIIDLEKNLDKPGMK